MFANTSMKSKHVTRNKGLVARLIATARLRKGKTAHNAQPDNSLLDTLFLLKLAVGLDVHPSILRVKQQKF